MKTTQSYSPKVSIEVKKLEALIKICTDSINHSFQSESWIRSNPHEHVNLLRKTITTIASKLIESKQWICLYARAGEITEELDEINQEDQKKSMPDQDIRFLHDIIDEYVKEAEDCFNYDPTDQELSNFDGVTSKERLAQSWQQKMEAKG